MNKPITILSILLFFSIDVFSQTTIQIDGFFDDWSTNVNTYIDDSTDSQGIDLLGFSVCNDNEYLYVKIRLADEIDLTEQSFNPAKVMINIDADNNSSTGYSTNNIGSEYGIDFFNRLIFDDTDPNMTVTLSLYDLGIIPLPTITSDEFEIAINRSLFSDTISISIRETVGNDFMPDNGSVFTYIFNNCSSPTTTAIDFSKNDPNNLRLMTYNVLSNGLINNNRVDKHRRIFQSAAADIITFQECGNTTVNDILGFLNTINMYYPYIYTYPSSGNITISKYPSVQSWQVSNKIDAELIDLPDSIYSTDILILNAHPPCCGNNQGRQYHFDAFIQFIHDAKTVGGVIDLPINTPISFSGDMNLVGYSEQYNTIVNGTISDTVAFGNGGFPDWDNTPLEDQVCYFNEKNIAYTWDGPGGAGSYPPGRLDFVFFTNSVMSVDKSFTISTEHMSASLLAQNNLYWDDTKNASDHFPVIVDFVLPVLTGCTDSGATNYDPSATIDDGSCTYPATCGPITGVYMSDVIHDRATFNWDNMNSSVCNVDQIRIRYQEVGTSGYTNKTMGAPVGSGCNTANISKRILGLSPSTTYEYDFKLWYCGASTVNWHAGGTFTTAVACDNITNVTATPVNTTKTTFCWTAPASSYSFVRLKYREDAPGSSFSNIGGMGVAFPTLCKDKNGITPGLSYRVMWRTWCNPSGGPYRAAQWDGPVTWTQPTSIRLEGESTAITNLEVYPNPSRDIFNITFISNEKQDFEIRIINVIGENIFIESKQQFIGEYTKQISLEEYPKAIYFLEIETQDGVINKKLILQ